MNDLTAFLKARIDEDDRSCLGSALTDRRFREVAAKRLIMAEHDECEEEYAGERDICETLRALATVYSDHPGYRHDWVPQAWRHTVRLRPGAGQGA